MIIPNNNKQEEQVSMLCEQGDMGLWNTPLSQEEQKAYNESVEREKGSKEEC